MDVVKMLMEDTTKRVCGLVDTVLAEQRTLMADKPEKEIRLLALEQMAQHYEKEAQRWYRMAETYEAQECTGFARKAREFADLIREGKHP